MLLPCFTEAMVHGTWAQRPCGFGPDYYVSRYGGEIIDHEPESSRYGGEGCSLQRHANCGWYDKKKLNVCVRLFAAAYTLQQPEHETTVNNEKRYSTPAGIKPSACRAHTKATHEKHEPRQLAGRALHLRGENTDISPQAM